MSSTEHGSGDGADIRTALATLVAQEPDLPSGSADIERRGRRRLATRRLGGAAAVVVLAAAGVSALSLTSGPAEPARVAQPPDAPAVGSGLADGLPVDSAVEAAASALPAGVSLAVLPMDIGWRSGGVLEVPVVFGPVTGAPGAPTHVITIQVADGSCSAAVEPAGALSEADLAAVAEAVCAELAGT